MPTALPSLMGTPGCSTSVPLLRRTRKVWVCVVAPVTRLIWLGLTKSRESFTHSRRGGLGRSGTKTSYSTCTPPSWVGNGWLAADTVWLVNATEVPLKIVARLPRVTCEGLPAVSNEALLEIASVDAAKAGDGARSTRDAPVARAARATP